MAGRGGCSLQSSVLAISVLYLLVLGLLLALATVLALDPGPGLATLLELVDTADSRLAGSAVAASVRGLVTSAQHHLALPLTLLVVLLAATVMLAAGAVFSRPLLLLPWLGNPIYRVSHNIGSTLFFVIFSGSGARTEEFLTFIQQPWKFAT